MVNNGINYNIRNIIFDRVAKIKWTKLVQNINREFLISLLHKSSAGYGMTKKYEIRMIDNFDYIF